MTEATKQAESTWYKKYWLDQPKSDRIILIADEKEVITFMGRKLWCNI